MAESAVAVIRYSVRVSAARPSPSARKDSWQPTPSGSGGSSTHSSAQTDSSSKAFSSERPFSVRWYSMRTGVSGITVRVTMPSASNSLSRSDSRRSESLGTEQAMSV
jgi:hypothetical protein